MVSRRIVFRVQGIPAGLNSDEVLSSLTAALLACGDASEEQLRGITKVDVVSACSADDQACALLNWQGDDLLLPHLAEDFRGVHQVEVGKDDWTIDRHFLGFTQLYVPATNRPVSADIIAITGLDGHAYGSFTSRRNRRPMWLHDFFSKDLPQCRTMIYGYDSKLSSRGIDTVLDYGRGFLEELKKVRRTVEEKIRPIFFIAHSFGGIILAHCLINAALAHEQEDEVGASLFKATYGILFFGTPHKGMMVDGIRKMINNEEDHPRNALLDQIQVNSNSLITELSRFKNIIRERKIVSFYEQKQTRGVKRDQDGNSWTHSGSFNTAVEVDSAVLQLPDSMEVKVPVNSDNSNMVRFGSRQDQGYTSALQYLKEFESDAPFVIMARFARAKTAPTPSFNVPFRRDDSFVGHEKILHDLMEVLTRCDRHNRAALHGLGGVGKSQIAIEFSYRFRERHPDAWIFWVYGANAVRFEQSFREIASGIELLRHDDPKSDIPRLVFRWLSNENNGRWLMILDSADDKQTFYGSEGANAGQSNETNYSRAPLTSLLPQTRNGSILVTSRNKLLASDLILGDDSNIQIGNMDITTAMLLMQTKIAVSSDLQVHCEKLLHALDCLPLAIVQAASYIRARAPRITILAYLRLFEESGETTSVLDDPMCDPRRDRGLPVSLFSTWRISYDQIRQQSRPAAILFSQMVVLDRQEIPELLFHDEEYDASFEYALAPLLAFSLVNSKPQGRTFSLHRLVQMAGRRWLEETNELQSFQEWSVVAMSRVFPARVYENKATCESLFPHVEPILKYVHGGRRHILLKGYKIANRCSSYLRLLGKPAAAEGLARQISEDVEQELGPLHRDTLISLTDLALVLSDQGKYEVSEKIHRRALAGFEQQLGTLNPETLKSLSNLALVLSAQGKYEESEAMNLRALAGFEEVLGPLHPDTLTSVSNIASVLKHRGEYKAAETMHRQALAGCEQQLGLLHPNTLSSVSNLASVLAVQGKYEESEAMNQRALAGSEQELGPLHIDTLTSVSNLASVLQHRGKHRAAETMHRRALAGYKQELGLLHLHTLTSLSSLACALQDQGKYEEAEVMSRRAVAGMEQALGPLHPDTLTGLWNLAHILRGSNRNQEARPLCQRASDGSRDVLGTDHPDTVFRTELAREWGVLANS